VLRPSEKTHIDIDLGRDAVFADQVKIVVADREAVIVPVTQDDY